MANYKRFMSGFNITTDSVIDTRLILSKEEMREAEDTYNLPALYFAICTDDKKVYIYDVNSAVTTHDPDNNIIGTGKYHPLEEYLTFDSTQSITVLNTALKNCQEIIDISDKVDVIDDDVVQAKNDIVNLNEEIIATNNKIDELHVDGGEITISSNATMGV